jgi:transposase-like protein
LAELRGFHPYSGLILWLADSETEDSWRYFLKCPKDRGLASVDLVVSGDPGGLFGAVAVEF